MRIVVLDAGTLRVSPEEWSPFHALGELVLFEHTSHGDESSIIERCTGANIVLTNKVPLGERVFESLPGLQCVCVLATGYNIIDLPSAEARSVTVCNVPRYSSASVAQHTLALILTLCHQVEVLNESVHRGDWVSSRFFSYWEQPVLELEGRCVGIIGFGDIGRRVGKLLTACGARVMAVARRKRDTPDWPGFSWGTVEEVFSSADIVSLHCPQTKDNFRFVNEALLARMRPTAFLVNTARGSLVNEEDLADALNRGVIAGAALDVISSEPMPESHVLRFVNNCIITPHMAWSSLESRRRLLACSLENISAYLRGEPINVVNCEVG